MRRLPVYLVLDTSGSMSGEAIEAVNNGVQTMISALRQDPYALETAYLSIITFDTTCRQVFPLTELTMINIPSFQASGQTSLGAALSLLAHCICNEVTKTTYEAKGDWKPLVFIMTDGQPTDNWRSGLEDFKKVTTGTVVACAAGHSVDSNMLKELTETVVQLDSADSASLKAYFQWVTSSISVSSSLITDGGNANGSGSDLPPPPPVIVVV